VNGLPDGAASESRNWLNSLTDAARESSRSAKSRCSVATLA